MTSMTGFGRGRCEVGGRRLVVEVRSVNHRFLELKLRLPWTDPLVEQQVGAAVRRRLQRGAVSLSVRDESGAAGAAAVVANLPLARAYAEALREVASACGLAEVPSLALVTAQPGVLTAGEDGGGGEGLWAQLEPGVEQALAELVAARAREGEALRQDLTARSRALRAVVTEVGRLAEEAPDEARRRLDERLRKLLAGADAGGASRGATTAVVAAPGTPLGIDPQRLAQEVALIADRADITEEVTRFHTHLDEVDRLLGAREAAGRRLDFLAQELHREVNTMGSKSQRAEIASRVIEAKAELERLREQVQNIE